jgi:hypothetical protein
MNKSCEKKPTEPKWTYLNKHCVFHCSKSKTIHGGTSVQTIIYKHYKGHMDVLYNIKRKKYKTVCAELAFTKSPSTEWSWFCIELVIW